MRTGLEELRVSPAKRRSSVCAATPRASAYHLRTSWWLEGELAEIARVIMEPSRYAEWWRCSFLASRLVRPGGPFHVGSTIFMRVKGFLPYTLSFLLTILEAHPERGFVASARGDIEGLAHCEVASRGAAGHVVLFDWRLEVRKPVVRCFSPLLRRLFALNHFWAMGRGRTCLQHEVLRGRRPDLPAPPPPLFPHNLSLVRRLYRRDPPAGEPMAAAPDSYG